MRKTAKFIVKHYKLIFTLFVIFAVLGAFFARKADTNYDLASYMPDDAPSIQGLAAMQDEFQEPLPNLRIVVEDITLPEAQDLADRLQALPGTQMLMWLGTMADLRQPVETLSPALLDTYYKNGKTALYQVSIQTDNDLETLRKVKETVNRDDAHYGGVMVASAFSQNATNTEVAQITAWILPLGILVMMFATESWVETPLLLITVGVAILLNMGLNYFFGPISFLTKDVAAILQLAVSMDYIVFMFHARYRYLDQGLSAEDALVEAIIDSAKSIVSSALTTVFGFLVLIFMRFRLGADLGVVLARGVAFSLFAAIFFLPTLILLCGKSLDKTKHRSFLPSFQRLSAFNVRHRRALLLILILVPICHRAQQLNTFTYGAGSYVPGSIEDRDQKYIDSVFAPNTQIVVIVPQGQWGAEKALVKEVKQLPMVKSAISYSELVGEGVPAAVVPEAARSALLSDKSSRIIFNTSSPEEGEDAFALVENVRDIAQKYYGDEARILGYSVTMWDMKETVQEDNKLVNLMSILSIGLVIMINFQSLILPVLLVLTIELSIWINLSVPYFLGDSISYVGYLIISSIQLGATVDYGILYTDNYLKIRPTTPKKEALIQTGTITYGSIIPPGCILALAGFLLYRISSMATVSELGTVLCRGALLSLTLVIFFLPALYYLCDPLIEKLTRGCQFWHGDAEAWRKENPDLALLGAKRSQRRAMTAKKKAPAQPAQSQEPVEAAESAEEAEEVEALAAEPEAEQELAHKQKSARKQDKHAEERVRSHE